LVAALTVEVAMVRDTTMRGRRFGDLGTVRGTGDIYFRAFVSKKRRLSFNSANLNEPRNTHCRHRGKYD
jgi:hypothetical protein